MKKATKSKKSKPNGKYQESPRRQKKAVGHDGGKRVAALRHRTNTIPSNGDQPTSMEVAPEKVPVGEAIRRAVEELGDVVIDEQLAPGQLRQLADAYEEIAKRAAEYASKSEAAKVAKKSYDGAVEFLLARVKEFTHPTPLPLFDRPQAEADHADMLDAANGAGERDPDAIPDNA